MKSKLFRWSVNEDADRELCYWMGELFASLKLGAVFAVATGLFIAFVPKDGNHPGGEFLGDFWPYVVECAFWLGMLIGMLWGAGKRFGSALADTLPWQQPREERAATGRFFGQWSAFTALLAFFLWFTPQIALAAGMGDMALFASGLLPLSTACWIAAGIFALVALVSRRRPGGQGIGWPRRP